MSTGRLFRRWSSTAAVQSLAFVPARALPLLAAAVGETVVFLATGTGSEEETNEVAKILKLKASEEKIGKVVSCL